MHKTAIVTGANGFLGRKLVNYLINHDWDIIAVTRQKIELEHPNIKNVIMDCQNIDRLVDDCTNQDIDCFFHLAWEGTSGVKRCDESTQLNNVANACKAIKVAAKIGVNKFINFGSVMEYEALAVNKCNEINDELTYSFCKFNAHMLTKILAKQLNIKYNSVCISNIFGPDETSSRFLNRLIKNMLNNENMELSSGQQDYDFIYIDDAIRAIVLVAEEGCNYEEYYIGTEDNKKLIDYIFQMKEIVRNDYQLNIGKNTGIQVDYSILERSKIYQQLGFSLENDFNTGILKTLKNMREE